MNVVARATMRGAGAGVLPVTEGWVIGEDTMEDTGCGAVGTVGEVADVQLSHDAVCNDPNSPPSPKMVLPTNTPQ